MATSTVRGELPNGEYVDGLHLTEMSALACMRGRGAGVWVDCISQRIGTTESIATVRLASLDVKLHAHGYAVEHRHWNDSARIVRQLGTVLAASYSAPDETLAEAYSRTESSEPDTGSYDVDDFLAGYLDGVLFTESVGQAGYGDDPDDDTSLLSYGFERSAFAADAVARMRAECVDFIAANLADLERYSELRGDSVRCSPDSFGRTEYSAAECAGTDFWLSRNGHGAGYFDRGDDPVFRRLQDPARVYGETYVYFNGDEIAAE